MINGDYILVIPPSSYPGKLYRGKYAYEHHVVWWMHNDSICPENYVIHHKNHIKKDNSIENLQLIDKIEHIRYHAKRKTMITLYCEYCRLSFDKDARNVRHKIKEGQTRFYCCRSHQVRHQQWLIKQNKIGM